MFPSAISLVQEGQRVIPINSQARWKTDTSAWDNALANDSTDYHFGKYTHHAINTKNYWPLAEDADVSAFPQIVGYEPVLAPSVRGNAGKITRGAFYVKYPGSDVPQRVPLTYDSNYHVNHGAGWSKFLQNLNQSIWRGTFDTSLLDDVDF